jgi:hypothetical protein
LNALWFLFHCKLTYFHRMKRFAFFAALLCAFSLVSCKKDDDKNNGSPSSPANVKLRMDHSWAGAGFSVAENDSFANPLTGDTVSFTKLRYYISNVRLKRANGTFYTQPDSYFLVDAEDPFSVVLDLGNVPAGEYTDLYYVFGVDSLHNVSGAQSGALDPANAMFWSWSTGYIMLKAEGLSPNSSSGDFAFHLGGFYGANSAVIEKHIDLSQAGSLNVDGAVRTIHIDVPVHRLWGNCPPISIFSNAMSPGADTRSMAVSFTDAMTLDHIE